NAKEIRISGCIYNDKNENGLKDKREQGIKNIPVSDGKQIVFTNSKGIYSLKTTTGNSIFPILPSVYSFSVKQGKVFNSNYKYLSANINNDILNFSLVKKKRANLAFSFSAVGDIQVSNDTELNYAAKSIGAELASAGNFEFNLLLGDLVNDNPSLLPSMKGFFSNFHSPTWTVYGNHDRFVIDSTTTDEAFNQTFGASVYAFNRGLVHFIVLNSISSKGQKGYEGRFSDDQFEFVKNDLKLVPENHLIVISQHIPLKHIKNGQLLLDLLADRKQVLILSGHTHTTERYFHNIKGGLVHEIGVGASCGNWWTGEKNAFGVPVALMQCGSLPNYYVIDINKNKYSFRYKGIGQDSDNQMGIWSETSASKEKNDSIQILANIFGGSDSTIVTLRLNNEDQIMMKKAKVISPNVEQLVDKNKANIYPTTGNTRNPIRKSPSPHIWAINLPHLLPGTHLVEIIASDRFGLSVTQKQLIYIP
ncbi:MAG TPA: calcineurin-like phosphoesterase family protein, partial [Paludibacter sp.]|nr:calcineurin-like phosphoesterase family protein [Paludibacter sp.]